jgi:hypothetical protein
MAAGLGFKTFNTGEVLTSADVNGYLMQGVLVFASEAARDAAITSPQEGQFAYTKDNNSLWYYTGSAWAASGATGDIEGVTAGTGISGGGTSGTVTITNSMATEIDAKGDLVVGTGADTFARLAVGANGTVLTAASGEATGLQWATPAASGFVGAQLTKTAQSVATGDYYAVTWDSEAFDTNAFHDNSTNNSRVTIPSGKSGYYRFSGIMTFASNSTGSRLVRIHKNGSNIVWVGWLAGLAGGNETGVVFCHTLNATAGDYFELFVKQESGSSLNVTASASWDVQFLGA